MLKESIEPGVNYIRAPEVWALGFTGQFHWVNHHVAHAASAYYASGFENAAVLTVDGNGPYPVAGPPITKTSAPIPVPVREARSVLVGN